MAEPVSLVVSPIAADAVGVADALAAEGLGAVVCASLADAAERCEPTTGCLVLTSESLLDRAGRARLRHALDDRLAPGPLPVLLLTGRPCPEAAGPAAAAILGAKATVHVLERPVERGLLLRHVRDAVALRHRVLAATMDEHPVLDLLGLGVVLVDAAGERVVHACGRAHRLLGVGNGSLSGSTVGTGPLAALAERFAAPGNGNGNGHHPVIARLAIGEVWIKAIVHPHGGHQVVLLHAPDAVDGPFANVFARQVLDEQFARFAHDLKAPLRQSLLWQDLLAAEDDLGDEARIMLARSTAALQNLVALVEETFCRTQDEAPTDCELHRVLDAVRDNLALELEETTASLQVGPLPERLPLPQAEAVRLFQNLVHNALRYRREEPPRIAVDGAVDGDCVRLRVRDNGMGIDNALLPTIFAKGQTGRYGKQRGGTGTGLAVCRSIVTGAGGRIWAESEVDSGSTFTIELPLPA